MVLPEQRLVLCLRSLRNYRRLGQQNFMLRRLHKSCPEITFWPLRLVAARLRLHLPRLDQMQRSTSGFMTNTSSSCWSVRCRISPHNSACIARPMLQRALTKDNTISLLSLFSNLARRSLRETCCRRLFKH